MQGTVYHRLFNRLADLVPDLFHPIDGAAYYTPPRLEGDFALHCAVSKIHGSVFEVEIAQDETVQGGIQPAPWLAFRVKIDDKTAELLVMHDQWRYEAVMSEGNQPNPQRAQMNVFAVNCLTSIINLGGVFHPVDAFAAGHQKVTSIDQVDAASQVEDLAAARK